ncbi:hypothetical protein BKA62DRAFT_771604 [Auriculariales sp. MPI-PUGE-AT-0066]|nr:hypothetical protein BKA62DRAFT_771604 [Auriculariales sp. MPI-PUGE-AT-0066]
MSGTVAPLSPSAAITRLDEVQPYDKLQWIMQRAHSVIKQGYASIMKHLDNPPLDDLTNFIGYCDSWVGCIVNHHDSEEATLFPALARHLDMSTEQSQHKVMHDHLDDIHAYLTHPDTLQSFSADKLREKMLAVRDVLFDHLDAEIKHLGRENLEPHWSAEELDAMLKALDDYAKAHVDLWTELPFAIGHVPPPYRGNFPAFPWIMRVTVIPVIALRYSGRWKYCPYNAFSMSD